MPYNKLQPEDELLVNQGSESYSIKADTLKAEMANYDKLQSTDLMLVNRGTDSYSVQLDTLREEIAPKGEIDTPVAVISPADGAGMGPENVYPAAEGITGVVEESTTKSSWNQDQYWSNSLSISGSQPESGSPIAETFDGNLNTFVRPAGSSTGMLAEFPEKIMGKVRIYASVGGGAFLKINGNDYANRFPDWDVFNQADAKAWVDLSDDEDGIESFEVVHSGGTISYLRAIEVNDQILVDNTIDSSGAGTVTTTTATLTYTTDNNLDLLVAGQAMTQKPAYTPVTDTIVTIENSTLDFSFSSSVTYSTDANQYPNEPPSNAFDGSTSLPQWTIQNNKQTNEFFASFELGPDGISDPLIGVNGRNLTLNYSGGPSDFPAIWVNDDYSTAQFFTADGDDKDFQFTGLVTKVSIGSVNKPQNHTPGDYFTIYSFRLNGELMVDGSTPLGTELTFNTDKDLANFRTGDVVQTASTWIRGDFNSPPIFADGQAGEYSGFPHTNAFDGNTNSQALPAAGGNTWTWDFPSISISNKLRIYYSGNVSYCVINGRTLGQYSPTLESNYADIPASAFTSDGGTLNEIYIQYYDGGEYCYLQAVEIDGRLLVDNSVVDPFAVKVVSTDDIANNKLTVSGGSWSEGSGVPADENQDEVWSDYVTGTLYSSFYKTTRGFDGDPSTQTGGDLTFRPPSPIPCSKIRVTTTRHPTSPQPVYLNGVDISSQIPSGTLDQQFPIEFDIPNGGDEFVSWQCDPGGQESGWWSLIEVYVDSQWVKLINAVGQTQVTGPLCQGTGEYVSHTANTLELTNVGDRWCVDDQNVGLAAVSDTEYTILAPDPNEIVFQSANGEPLTTTFSAENCVLREITWTLGVSETGEAETYVETEYKQSVTVPINIEVPPWAGPPDGLANDTYYSLKVKYEADSRAEAVESNTIYFKTRSGDEPQVQMFGLRFDNTRSANLNGSTFAEGEFSNKLTLSCWYKPSQFYDYHSIIGFTGSGDSPIIAANNQGGIYSIYGSQLLAGSQSSGLTLNKWTHIVLTVAEGGKTVMYLDGETFGVSNNTVAGALTTLKGFNVGSKINTIGGNPDQFIHGYLSDVYCIDGQILEPSAFGKDYDGLWGPLPNETVLNNITRDLSPYDERPNMDEEWSVNVSTDNGEFFKPENGPEYAFDGNTSTPASSKTTGNNGWIEFTTTVPLNSKISVFTRLRNTIDLNGTEIRAQTSDATTAWSEEYDCSGATTIRVYGYGPTSGTAEIYAVKVNGRVLIDGPADNSQNWSDTVNTNGDPGMPNAPYTNMFTANESELANASNSGGKNLTTWEFNPPIGNGVDDVIEVKWYVSRPDDTDFNPQVNGADFSARNNVWETVPETQVISVGLCHNQGAAANGVYGFKVNGKLLVDAGAQWDTSQVWSEGASGGINRPGFDPSNAFDGDLTTFFNSDDTESAVFSFTNLTIQSSLRLFCRGANGNLAVTLSGVQQPITTDSGDAQWRSASVTGPVDFTSIDIAGSQIGLYAVEVDGKILVDAGSLGDNGFYLPFDPSAEGAKYSIGVNSVRAGSQAENGFNGSVSNFVEGAENENLVVDFSHLGGVSYSSLIEIYTTAGTPYTRPCYINNNAASKVNTVAGWNTIVSGSGTMNSLTVEQGDAVTGVFSAIRVDGKILIDYNSIGVDASGNGNNFHDENFAVGNTSQVWSNTITITNGSADNNNINQNAFDGVLNSSSFMTCANNGGGAVATFTFNPPIGNGVDDVVEVAWYRVGAVSVTPQVNGKDENSVTEGKWFNAGSQLVSLGLSHSEGFGANGIYGIRLNGQLLIDANIQDTVVDTPIKNYAVHTGAGASNGNLVQTNVTNANAKSTSVTFAADSKIYFESFMQNGSDYHIGVTNGSGTVSIVRNDGTLTAATLSSGTAITWAQGDTIGVTIDVANKTMTLQKTGSPGGDIATYTLNNCAAGYSPLVSTGAGVQVNNFGQQPFVYTPPAGYDGLYQLFEDWQKGGAYFYDENNQEVVRATHLRHRYGRDTADNRLGIYDLTEQPSHQVIGYEKVGDKYQPLRDYTPEVRTAQAETAVAEAQADKYLSFLKSAATAWAVGKIYNEGGIIEFNGKLYRALTDATSTADNDPADDTADWEDLGINS